MIGLSENEMMNADIDYIYYRFNGWSMLRKADELDEWKRTRMVAYTIAKSMGATKSRKPEDFIKLDEPQRQSRLTPEQIERLKNL